MNILVALSILFGQPNASMPAEDDIRHEQVWNVSASLLGQHPDSHRIYEPSMTSDGIVVFVGMYDDGTECTLGVYWSEHVEAWTGLLYECA
jgi:hypothetical protein